MKLVSDVLLPLLLEPVIGPDTDELVVEPVTGPDTEDEVVPLLPP